MKQTLLRTFRLIPIVFMLVYGCGQGRTEEQKISPQALETLRMVKEQEMETWRLTLLKGEKQTRPQDDFDALYYRLDLNISLDPNNLEATVTGRFKSLADSLQTIILDFDDALTIDEVTGSVSGYDLCEEEYEILLDRPYAAGETFEITTAYHGLPRLLNGIKAFNFRKHGNVPVVATLSTPFLAHTWWPCKDGPEDKPDSVDIIITIPDSSFQGYPLYASSNGKLMGIVDNGDGTKTFSWHEGYPIPVYYVGIAVSNYRIFSHFYRYSEADSMEVPYYVFPESYDSAQVTFGDVVEMIGFLSGRFGQYPFLDEKYAMSEIGFYGAIENQTNTIMGGVDPGWNMVVLHELAHQWFGDMITCANWHHGWVNEGFASYCEALWVEHLEGPAGYQDYMDESLSYFGGGTVYLEDVTDPFQVFVGIIYSKGAWILHMLRHVVGDEDFWTIMQSYAQQYAYGHAGTEDFQAVCEDVHGTNLDWFFHPWIYEEFHPIYAYSWSSAQHDDHHELTLTIEQVQDNTGLFIMPIDVTVRTEQGMETFVVFDSLQTQIFHHALDSRPLAVALDTDNWILKKIIMPGDVSGEGTVNIVDMIFAAHFILGTMDPRADQFRAADCNGDKTLNVLDLVCMANIILLGGS